jgi:hypothetical protein
MNESKKFLRGDITMKKKLEIVKFVGGLIISAGVSAIVSNAINATTPTNTKAMQKFYIGVGSFVLASLLCDKAITYVGDTFNKIIKTAKESSNQQENSNLKAEC